MINSSKTFKEQEDRKALSKNNGKAIRYRIRLQQEEEAKAEQKEEMKRMNQWEKNEREDL